MKENKTTIPDAPSAALTNSIPKMPPHFASKAPERAAAASAKARFRKPSTEASSRRATALSHVYQS